MDNGDIHLYAMPTPHGTSFARFGFGAGAAPLSETRGKRPHCPIESVLP